MNQLPGVTKLKESMLHKILAISFSFQNSFYFHDRLSVSGGISVFARVGIVNKRTILTTNRTLTGFTQPHENRSSSNRNSHSLSKVKQKSFTGFGEIPPGLSKLHWVSQKSTGFRENPPGLARNSPGLGSTGAVTGG